MSKYTDYIVEDIDGAPLPEEEQRNWRYARSIGLRPALVYFIAGKPMAVYADGSGLYGPCPEAPESFKG